MWITLFISVKKIFLISQSGLNWDIIFRVNANRVTAYEELDTDLVKNAAYTSLDGVSLSLLADKLYNENLVREPDEVWNWNLLFTQISSEINSETQKKIEV